MAATVLPLLDTTSTERVPPSDARSTIVSIDSERMGGVPCFTGTRVPVQDLWDYLAGGESIDDFLECFPTVSREQAVQAIQMAGQKLLKGLQVGKPDTSASG